MVTNSFGNRNFMQPMGSLSMHSKCLDFFSFKGWLRIFFYFLLVPNMFASSSHQVLNMFFRLPICSPRVFPIAPRFHPICFAQSLPLLTYIHGPKEEALHLSIKFSKVSTFFLRGPIKLARCKKKKLDL
jgi:hypothetical protein